MNIIPKNVTPPPMEKFSDPCTTAKGEKRASVPLSGVKTLWFNTGTLCNIECTNCYIESSPSNDALVYLSENEVAQYLEQIKTRDWPVVEIGITGGEPFMNPDIIAILKLALSRGYRVLVLTNAMRPMMRTRVNSALKSLIKTYGDQLAFRVSLDHYETAKNDQIRGTGTFEIACEGISWLRDQGASLSIAGRMLWDEDEQALRSGFSHFFNKISLQVNAHSPAELVLFPEMDIAADVPEITTECWSILNKDPRDVMCATSRMVVKRKGAKSPTVLSCTLLPYSAEFDLGETLQSAEKAVSLNHPHCAKFCVLGGASCSV